MPATMKKINCPSQKPVHIVERFYVDVHGAFCFKKKYLQVSNLYVGKGCKDVSEINCIISRDLEL